MRKNRVLGKYSHTETYLPILTHQLNTQRQILVHIFSFIYITKFVDIHFFPTFSGRFMDIYYVYEKNSKYLLSTQGLP